jgi:hypothetical protein
MAAKRCEPACQSTAEKAVRLTVPGLRLRSYSDAQATLLRLQDALARLNPSAARTLEEGLEETLTLHRLKVSWNSARRSAANVIESAVSIVRVGCCSVERLRPGSQN